MTTLALAAILDAWVIARGERRAIASIAAMRTSSTLAPLAFNDALLAAHARGLLYALPVDRASPDEIASGVIHAGATLTHAMRPMCRATKTLGAPT